MTNKVLAAPLQAGQYAFFFDVDGTLATLQPRPQDVCIPVSVRDDLAVLRDLTQGALALVSGRPMYELDVLVEPLQLPVAGVHGAERRDTTGHIERISLSARTREQVGSELEQAIASLAGTQLESKGMAFALHYRRAPQHKAAIERLASDLVARFPELVQQPGKCVVELKPAGVNKGAAIERFLLQSPFAGRIPVFIGDDLTDEAGFAAVNAAGGVSVKVGEEPSNANYYLPSVTAVWQWLEHTRRNLELGARASARSEMA